MPEPENAATLVLVVDAERCQGHNRCHVLLPQLVRIDDLGFAHAVGDGRVPPEQADQARLAVRNCPEFALRLVRNGRQEDAS